MRSSTNFDRPAERIDLDILPPLEDAAQKPARSRKLSYFMISLVDWGEFMVIFESAANSVTRARLLIHSGHGGVASFTSDISCVHNASAESVRVTPRRISEGPAWVPLLCQ